jgi:hypothetical protein
MQTLSISDEPDLTLVDRIATNNDEAALIELTERHSGVFFNTLKKNVPFAHSRDIYDDFYARRHAFVYDAAKNFKKEFGVKFSTCLANLTRYKCLKAREDYAKQPDTVLFNSVFHGDSEELTADVYLEKKDVLNEIFGYVKEHCSETDLFVIKEYYTGGKGGVGRGFDDIGQELGISTQAAQKRHSNVIKKLQAKAGQLESCLN